MESTVLTQVLDVLSAIAEWFVDALNALLGIFYVEGTGLTVIGIIALCSFAIGVILLLVNWIKRLFV